MPFPRASVLSNGIQSYQLAASEQLVSVVGYMKAGQLDCKLMTVRFQVFVHDVFTNIRRQSQGKRKKEKKKRKKTGG